MFRIFCHVLHNFSFYRWHNLCISGIYGIFVHILECFMLLLFFCIFLVMVYIMFNFIEA